MRISELATKNYQFVFIIIFLAVLVGMNSILNMPRSEDPNPQFPFYTVVAVYPGSSPIDVEELVVEPIEDEIDKLEDIDAIKTKIEEGIAVIQVEAKFGIDTDEKFDELQLAVSGIEKELPELFSLEVQQFEPNSRVKIQQLAIGSNTLPIQDLYPFAEDLQSILEDVKGVREVKIEADPEEIVKIEVDFQKLANYNINLGQLVEILRAENLNIPSGSIPAGELSLSVKSSGKYESIEEIENTVISTESGGVIYLRDVADVKLDLAEDNWVARLGDERVVFLTVTQEDGKNIIQLTDQLNKEIEAFKSELPPSLFIKTVFEQAPAVKDRINGFASNLGQGILFVGLIVLFFLGIRSSVIIMIVIPLSIIMAINILDQSGYALEQISIAGLVIALGLLVDNGIVVVENIQRFLRIGHSPMQAAIKGTSEVGLAIISSTATTLLAFFPLAMLESGAGEFLKTLPLTVIFSLIISLLLALTLTPILASKFLKQKKSEGPGLVTRGINKIVEKAYLPVLRSSLKRGWLVLASAILFLVFSVSLFPSIGVSFFPTADKPLLLVEIEAPRGSGIPRVEKAVDYVSSVLDTMNYVDFYVSNAGHGNPMVYYNRPNEAYKNYYGQYLITFKEWDQEKFYSTLNNLRSVFKDYAGAKITFNELRNGPPFEAPIEIKIIGDEIDTLKKYALSLEEIIQQTEGTIDVENSSALNKPELVTKINRDKAKMYGISLASIDQALRVAVDGLTIDELSFNKESYDLVIQTEEQKENISSLNQVFVPNRFGEQIPISQVVDFSLESGIAELLHYNKERSIAVTANVIDAEKVTAITESIIAEMDKVELPKGYSFYVAGEYEGQQDSFGDLGALLLIALIGIFAVLVLQFRSLKQPLIVFAAIPFAVIGSFIALYLTGWSFSFFAFVGFNSLIGIVVNNSIILVDYTNQLMRSGKEKRDAIIEASKTRFTPILLTTTTTILGLVPLTFQGTNLWSPLGWTIIGGMISSTFLTLLIVPVLYNWFTSSKLSLEA